ncbi:hypothetical protein ScPMuIL_011492 [Solemya velum]
MATQYNTVAHGNSRCGNHCLDMQASWYLFCLLWLIAAKGTYGVDLALNAECGGSIIGTCDNANHLECKKMYDCAIGQCVCKSGYTLDGTTCKPTAAYGAACDSTKNAPLHTIVPIRYVHAQRVNHMMQVIPMPTIATQQPIHVLGKRAVTLTPVWTQRRGAGGTCTNNVCVCPTGMRASGKGCVAPIVGQACDAGNNQCAGTHISCTASTCSCDANHIAWSTPSEGCKSNSGTLALGAVCTTHAQCAGNRNVCVACGTGVTDSTKKCRGSSAVGRIEALNVFVVLAIGLVSACFM